MGIGWRPWQYRYNITNPVREGWYTHDKDKMVRRRYRGYRNPYYRRGTYGRGRQKVLQPRMRQVYRRPSYSRPGSYSTWSSPYGGGGYTKKRRYSGKRRYTKKRRILSKAQVKVVKGLVRAGPSKWDHRVAISGDAVTSQINLCNFALLTLMQRSTIDVLLGLPQYMGQTDAGADVEEDIFFNVTDKNVKFLIKQKSILKFRNNSATSIELHIWTLRGKVDTDSSPLTDYALSLDNEFGSDAGLETEVPFYPQHATAFMKKYKLQNHKHVKLAPGGETSYYAALSKFLYDHERQQANDLVYPKQSSLHVLIKINGTIVHDTTNAALVGIGAAQCDIVTTTHTYFRKLGDLRIPRITFADNLDAIAAEAQWHMGDPVEEKHQV